MDRDTELDEVAKDVLEMLETRPEAAVAVVRLLGAAVDKRVGELRRELLGQIKRGTASVESLGAVRAELRELLGRGERSAT